MVVVGQSPLLEGLVRARHVIGVELDQRHVLVAGQLRSLSEIVVLPEHVPPATPIRNGR
jgi:hypothetical protein